MAYGTVAAAESVGGEGVPLVAGAGVQAGPSEACRGGAWCGLGCAERDPAGDGGLHVVGEGELAGGFGLEAGGHRGERVGHLIGFGA